MRTVGDYVTSLRLPRELADGIELAARVQGKTFAEVCREAFRSYLRECAADPEFRQRLEQLLDADRGRARELLQQDPDC